MLQNKIISLNKPFDIIDFEIEYIKLKRPDDLLHLYEIHKNARFRIFGVSNYSILSSEVIISRRKEAESHNRNTG